MRSLSAVLTAEQHKLNSDHPMVFLAELTPGAGPVERLTNAQDDLTFHATTYTSRPFLLRQWGEGTASQPASLQAVFGNANKYANSLKENYWRGTIHPNWLVTFWYVDATNPDETPLASTMGTYRIRRLQLDDLAGVADLSHVHISPTRNVTLRRFTPGGGFAGLRFV